MTIYSPLITLNLRYIFLICIKLQLNKAYALDKGTSFLDLNIKVFTAIFALAFTTYGDSLLTLGLLVKFIDSQCTVFLFRSWFDLLELVLALLFHSKIFKSLQNYLQRGWDITSTGKLFRAYEIFINPNSVIFYFKNARW